MKVVKRAFWLAGWPARMGLLAFVRAYRLTLGQLTGGNCRFYPSCSEYAEIAIARTGASKGLVLAVWRILRCSPLSKGGIDRPPMGRTRLYDNNIQRVAAPAEVGGVSR